MLPPRVAFALALLPIAAACGVRQRHDLRWVTGQVEQRTGHVMQESTATQPTIPPGVSLEDGISQDEAVSLALANNPGLLEALTELGFSRGALIQAGLLSNPVFAILFPLGPKQLEFALKFPIEALWLRQKRAAAARFDAEQVAQQLVQSGLDVARDAKMKWADLRLAIARRELSTETEAVSARIASMVGARLEAGDISPLEAAAAEADALTAREDSLRLARDVQLAEAELRAAVGLAASDMPLRPQDDPTDMLAPPLPSSPTGVAFAARPDLRAAELTLEAARERAGLSRLEIVSLSGIADANGMGSRGFEIGPGLEVGIPIFDWNQGGMARADAEVERATRHEAAVRARIISDVNEGAARYEHARHQLDLVDTQVVPQLERMVKRAEEAFATGDTSRLEVLAARAQLLRARVRAAEAVAGLSATRADLERSMGCRLEAPTPEQRAAAQ